MRKKKVERSFPRFLPDFQEFGQNFETEFDLQSYYHAYYPHGSGPIGVMKVVCALLEKIALDKGFTLKKPGEDE